MSKSLYITIEAPKPYVHSRLEYSPVTLVWHCGCSRLPHNIGKSANLRCGEIDHQCVIGLSPRITNARWKTSRLFSIIIDTCDTTINPADLARGHHPLDSYSIHNHCDQKCQKIKNSPGTSRNPRALEKRLLRSGQIYVRWLIHSSSKLRANYTDCFA